MIVDTCTRNIVEATINCRKALKDIDVDEAQFKKIEAIILSMTKQERENPELLSGSRRKRLSEGSGNTIQEVNQFIKQFDEMRKMMKKFATPGAMKGMGMPMRSSPVMLPSRVIPIRAMCRRTRANVSAGLRVRCVPCRNAFGKL